MRGRSMGCACLAASWGGLWRPPLSRPMSPGYPSALNLPRPNLSSTLLSAGRTCGATCQMTWPRVTGCGRACWLACTTRWRHRPGPCISQQCGNNSHASRGWRPATTQAGEQQGSRSQRARDVADEAASGEGIRGVSAAKAWRSAWCVCVVCVGGGGGGGGGGMGGGRG